MCSNSNVPTKRTIPPVLEAGGKAGDDSRPGFHFPKL